MPKKARSRPEAPPNEFSTWVESMTGRQHGIYKKDLAEAIGISAQAFSNRLKKEKFDLHEIRTIFRMLGATEKKILELMK